MPKISMSSLADIASNSGLKRQSKVRALKRRGPYSPGIDFYKSLREGLVDVHRGGITKAQLGQLAESQSDPRRSGPYRSAVAAYLKWWGQKDIALLDPPRDTYSKHGVDVSVNPEMALSINGTTYLVKLHLNRDPLDTFKVNVITSLMELVLRAKCTDGEVMAVLDVNRAKLHPLGTHAEKYRLLIDGELAYIAGIWESL